MNCFVFLYVVRDLKAGKYSTLFLKAKEFFSLLIDVELGITKYSHKI